MIYKALVSGATYIHDDGSKSMEIFKMIHAHEHTDIFDDFELEIRSYFEENDSKENFFIVGATAEYVESGNGYDVIETDIEYSITEFSSLSEVNDFINDNT